MASNEDKTQHTELEQVVDGYEVVEDIETTSPLDGIAVKFAAQMIDSRTITIDDFAKHGVAVESDYVWDRENDFTVNASPEAAEFLATLPEFEVV